MDDTINLLLSVCDTEKHDFPKSEIAWCIIQVMIILDSLAQYLQWKQLKLQLQEMGRT